MTHFAGQLEPRSLTVEEVKEAAEMNITSLLDHDKTTSHTENPSIEDVPLEHLALGTNMEAAPVKDMVRMPFFFSIYLKVGMPFILIFNLIS